jgi:hypothetical protein
MPTDNNKAAEIKYGLGNKTFELLAYISYPYSLSNNKRLSLSNNASVLF